MIYKIINNYSYFFKDDVFPQLSSRQKYCAIVAIALSILLIGYCSVKFVQTRIWKTKKLKENNLHRDASLSPIIIPPSSDNQKCDQPDPTRKEADYFFQEAEKNRTANPALAFEYFLKAAKMNHVKAQFELGILYNDGIGITKNKNEAFKWFNKAAIAGSIQAQFNLSLCYSEGIGTPKHDIKAFKWMAHAAEAGHVEAQFYLGNDYLDGYGIEKDDAEGFKWLKKAAENGYIEAQYSTALCYQCGTGINKDLIQAFNWYKLAAEAGFGKAQYQLSTFYYTGTGVVQDYNNGLKWVTRAAESNDLEALEWLANEYYAEDRYEEAFRLYLQAAKLGDIVAQDTVADFYERGEMVGKDLKEAYFWYCKAAENGCETANEWIKNFG